MADEETDTSDIPEVADAQRARMRRPEHVRSVKKPIAARADADVIARLRVWGQGYRSRMNAILLRAMRDAT